MLKPTEQMQMQINIVKNDQRFNTVQKQLLEAALQKKKLAKDLLNKVPLQDIDHFSDILRQSTTQMKKAP